MPGMMDTILNVGCNDVIVETIAGKAGTRFAYDCYRRLLSMFGEVVLSIPHEDFEEALNAKKNEKNLKFDVELSGDDLKDLVQKYKDIYTKHNKVLPQDPFEQVKMCINAVFG